MIIVQYIILGYFIILAVVGFLTEYATTRSHRLKRVGRASRIPRIILYVILAGIPGIGAFIPKSGFKYFCMAAGNLWLGFFLYYFAGFLILLIPALIFSRVRGDKEKRAVRHAFYGAVIIAVAVNAYGLIHARQTKVYTYNVPQIEKNQGAKNYGKIKIVLIGDLHLSVNSVLSTTEKMVDKINACEPDIVLIAGDIFTSNYGGLSHPEEYAEALSRINAGYGVYAVCGNHDVEENLFGGFSVSPVKNAFRTAEMEQFFEDAGFHMLYDETLYLEEENITIVGRIDGEKAGDGTRNRQPAEEILKEADPDSLILVLQHEPDEYEELSASGADMVLSGHTHNGQVFPGNIILAMISPNAQGMKELYGMTTIVTGGVGTYGPPMRICTDSEISVINLK